MCLDPTCPSLSQTEQKTLHHKHFGVDHMVGGGLLFSLKHGEEQTECHRTTMCMEC